MMIAARIALLQLLVTGLCVAHESACLEGQCDAQDTQVLLQSQIQLYSSTIETVDDVDMLALGLKPEHLDKAMTKIVEGVPIFNYGETYTGGMNPSLLELAEAKEWIVQFAGTAGDADLERFCKAAKGNGHCDSKGHPTEGGVAAVLFRSSADELAQALQGFSPKPQFIESDQPMTIVPEIDEKDMSLEEEAALLELHHSGKPASWGLDRIDDTSGLDEEYKLPSSSSQGAGAHVYVADTGIRTTHSDFEGRAVPGIEALSRNVRVCSPTDTTCAMDGHSHGTHCAGTIGGKKYGVAKKTALYAVKVLSDKGSGSFSGIIKSVDWVASSGRKPAVWSASLGGRGIMNSVEKTFSEAMKVGVVISVAAGNNNADACGYTPAFAPSAITVAASSPPRSGKDPRAGFSNYGRCIDIFAPGVSIMSAGHKSDTASARMSGTSMACPHVSGAAAVFLGDAPTLTPAAVWAHMKQVALAGTVTDAKTNTPNLMLYVGAAAAFPPTMPPTSAPTMPPTSVPTMPPTSAPTMPPSTAPSMPPTSAPTMPPTSVPTMPPTTAPTMPPTSAPTMPPSQGPPLTLPEQLSELDRTVTAGFQSTRSKLAATDSALNGKLTSLEKRVQDILKVINSQSQ